MNSFLFFFYKSAAEIEFLYINNLCDVNGRLLYHSGWQRKFFRSETLKQPFESIKI